MLANTKPQHPRDVVRKALERRFGRRGYTILHTGAIHVLTRPEPGAPRAWKFYGWATDPATVSALVSAGRA